MATGDPKWCQSFSFQSRSVPEMPKTSCVKSVFWPVVADLLTLRRASEQCGRDWHLQINELSRSTGLPWFVFHGWVVIICSHLAVPRSCLLLFSTSRPAWHWAQAQNLPVKSTTPQRSILKKLKTVAYLVNYTVMPITTNTGCVENIYKGLSLCRPHVTINIKAAWLNSF